MKKIYFYAVFIVSGLLYGQEYFNEDFNQDAIPDTWEVIQNNTEQGWKISLPQTDGFLVLVTGVPSGGKQDEWLISPVIDLSNATNPAFYFEANYNQSALVEQNLADFILHGSKDGGATWEQVWIDSDNYLYWDYNTHMAIHNISIPSYAGESNVKFAFRLLTDSDNHSFDQSVWVDNVRVEENQQVAPESIVVTTMNGEPSELIVGDNVYLTANVFPDNSNPNYTWSITSGSDKITLDNNGYVVAMAEGTTIVRATSVENAAVFGEIEITVLADPFFDGCNQRFYGVGMEFFSVNADFTRIGASDFIIPENTDFSLKTISPYFLAGTFTNSNPANFGTFDVSLRADDNNTPGEVLVSYENLSLTSYEGSMVYKVHLDLPEAYVLSGGENGTKYWVTVSAKGLNGTNISWNGFPHEGSNETSVSYRSIDNGATWEPLNFNDGDVLYELVVDIVGTCEALSVQELDNLNKMVVYPNPTSGIVNFTSASPVHTVDVFSIDGKSIKSVKTSGQQIDLSGLNSGVYILRTKSVDGKTAVQKVIKK